MFLLDSNTVSELRSAQRCHPRVLAWEQRTPLAACWISVVTFLDIRQGIDQIRRKDPRFAAVLERWLEERVKPAFDGRVLAVTPPVAEHAGRIAAARTCGLAGCLIAATALEHRLTLATRNVADFADISGLEIVNPWDE